MLTIPHPAALLRRLGLMIVPVASVLTGIALLIANRRIAAVRGRR